MLPRRPTRGGNRLRARDPRSPDRVRHRQPRLEPGAGRLRPRLPGRLRRRRDRPAERGRQQGQRLRHHRPGRSPRRHAERPLRRRAGGRAELDAPALPADARGRARLRSRHLRHEGLRRLCPGPRAPPRGERPGAPGPPRPVLRRGGRLLRRARHRAPPARDRPAPARRVRRRADEDGRRQRPQGQLRGADRGAGPLVPLVPAGPGRQRRLPRRRPDRVPAREGGGARGRAGIPGAPSTRPTPRSASA